MSVKRPKWARTLDAVQWKQLCERQLTSEPTFKRFKAMREHQVKHKLRDPVYEGIEQKLITDRVLRIPYRKHNDE